MSAARPDGWSGTASWGRHPPIVVICGNRVATARATRMVSTCQCSSLPTLSGSAANSAPRPVAAVYPTGDGAGPALGGRAGAVHGQPRVRVDGFTAGQPPPRSRLRNAGVGRWIRRCCRCWRCVARRGPCRRCGRGRRRRTCARRRWTASPVDVGVEDDPVAEPGRRAGGDDRSAGCGVDRGADRAGEVLSGVEPAVAGPVRARHGGGARRDRHHHRPRRRGCGGHVGQAVRIDRVAVPGHGRDEHDHGQDRGRPRHPATPGRLPLPVGFIRCSSHPVPVDSVMSWVVVVLTHCRERGGRRWW